MEYGGKVIGMSKFAIFSIPKDKIIRTYESTYQKSLAIDEDNEIHFEMLESNGEYWYREDAYYYDSNTEEVMYNEDFTISEQEQQQINTPEPDTEIFGSFYNYVKVPQVQTVVSSNWQNIATLNAIGLKNGTYRIGFSYGWNHDHNNSDFLARFQLDGNDLGEIHQQEPKESGGSFGSTGTNQKYVAQRVFIEELQGDHTITFDIASERIYGNNDDGYGKESSVWDVVVEIWRVL
jgi:hypothetical protein